MLSFDILVVIIFTCVAILLLFPSNIYVPLDRRIATSVGALICVLLLYIFPVGVRNALSLIDYQVIIVLASIMLINFLILRQPWTHKLIIYMEEVIEKDDQRGFYLVSLISFVVSPIIMNDGLCLILVDPVLDALNKIYERLQISDRDSSIPSQDIQSKLKTNSFYYMLTIACSANIGSTLTYSGNPQNLIIAQYLDKYMNCGIFFSYMIIPALVSWVFTVFILDISRRKALKMGSGAIGGKDIEMTGIRLDSSIDDLDITILESNHSPLQTTEENVNNKVQVTNNNIDDLNENELTDQGDTNKQTPKQLYYIANTNEYSSVDIDPFRNSYITFIGISMVLILEFIGIFPLTGLFAVSVIFLITYLIFYNYYTSNSSMPVSQRIHYFNQSFDDLFHSIDFNILIIFIGLFIVSGTFLQTNIPQSIWNALAGKRAFGSFSSTLVLSLYVVIVSQLIGNVPVIYMAKEEVDDLSKNTQIFAWLILSFVSTVAGNFTLVGSAANVIVAEKSRRYFFYFNILSNSI